MLILSNIFAVIIYSLKMIIGSLVDYKPAIDTFNLIVDF